MPLMKKIEPSHLSTKGANITANNQAARFTARLYSEANAAAHHVPVGVRQPSRLQSWFRILNCTLAPHLPSVDSHICLRFDPLDHHPATHAHRYVLQPPIGARSATTTVPRRP